MKVAKTGDLKSPHHKKSKLCMETAVNQTNHGDHFATYTNS